MRNEGGLGGELWRGREGKSMGNLFYFFLSDFTMKVDNLELNIYLNPMLKLS